MRCSLAWGGISGWKVKMDKNEQLVLTPAAHSPTVTYLLVLTIRAWWYSALLLRFFRPLSVWFLIFMASCLSYYPRHRVRVFAKYLNLNLAGGPSWSCCWWSLMPSTASIETAEICSFRKSPLIPWLSFVSHLNYDCAMCGGWRDVRGDNCQCCEAWSVANKGVNRISQNFTVPGAGEAHYLLGPYPVS